MVKIILIWAFLLPTNANLLFVSKYCGSCHEAKKLVPSDTKIIDIHENLILANKYRVRVVPTYIIIKNSQIVKRLVGLTEIRDYCNRFGSYSGVIYFDGPQNTLTQGIHRRIRRLGFTIRNGTDQEAIDYKITHRPSFIFIENGKEIGRYVGVKPR